jgi:hypothetical protein
VCAWRRRYIGYQVAHSSVGFFVVTFAALLVTTPIAAVVFSARSGRIDGGNLARNAVGMLLGTWNLLLAIGVPIIFQLVCNKYVFFKERWLRYRALCAQEDGTPPACLLSACLPRL